MIYLDKEGKNYLTVIKQKLGSWDKLQQQLLLRSINTTPSYLCTINSIARKRKSFPKLRPEMVIPLCECVNNEVTPKQLRPDIFSSTDERKNMGILKPLEEMLKENLYKKE